MEDSCGTRPKVRPIGHQSLVSVFIRPVVRHSNFANLMIFPIVRADELASRPTAPMPFVKANYDTVGGRHVSPPGLRPVPDGETGWDRLKEMFSTNEYGIPGPEWILIINATYGGLASGALLGGISSGHSARSKYMYRNQATTYESEMYAKKVLQDRITLGLFSGALRGGLKTGGFTFLYVFSTTLLSVYRGRTSFVDFVAAGTISGLLWRITMGPQAAIVSSVLGSCLGLFAGSICTLAFYLSGTTMEEVRYWHYRAIKDVTAGKQEENGGSSEERSKDVTV